MGAVGGGIVTIGTAQVRQVSDLLAVAFGQDPVSRWLEPDPAIRARMLSWLFTGFTGTCFSTGSAQVLCVGDDDHPVAAALWFQRNTPDDDEPLFDVGEGSRWSLFEQATTAAHPTAPHEYLMLMGVHPDHQGKGLGSRLLRRHLELADAHGTAAYLEATSPASRALYARHGFRDHGQPIHLPDGPVLYPMWRAPEAPRAESSAPRDGARKGAGRPGGSSWMG